MGAAAVPLLIAVGSTAASAVISNQLAEKPKIPDPIAPPAPPEIPTEDIKEAADPEDLAREQAAKARSARRREAARLKGSKLTTLDTSETSNTTLIGD